MKTTKKLPVPLTDDEKLERGKQLADNIRKTALAEQERKAENDRRNGDIKLLEGITSKLVEIIASGAEERHVECEIRRDFERNTVTVVRLDTGEIVESRIMTPEERQEELLLEPPKDRQPAKGKGGDPFGAGEAP